MLLKQIYVGYHKAMKKIPAVSWMERNKFVCNAIDLLMFSDLT